MHTVSVIAMIIGVIGFALNYAGILTLGSPVIWGGVAAVGMVFTVMTRRPSD